MPGPLPRRTTGRVPALATAAVLAVTSLTACGSDGDGGDDPEASASEGTATGEEIAGVTVTGDFGKEPEVEVEKLELEGAESAVIIEGEGDDIADDAVVKTHSLLVNGKSGETIESSYAQDGPQSLRLADPAFPPPLADALAGQPYGSRVAVAVTLGELPGGEQGAPQIGLAAEDAVVFVFDLIEEAPKPLDGPEGEAVEPPADSPTVVEEDGQVTGLDFSDAPRKPPTELQVITLVEGTGEKIEATDTVTADYLGTVWGKGDEPFDESYSAEPVPFGLDGVIKGWTEGLTGVPVGSRVMLVIPAELGYGEQGSPPDIPGGATLVFVIDVLGRNL